MSMEIRLYGHGVELRITYGKETRYYVYHEGKLVGNFDDKAYAKAFAEGFREGIIHG